MRQKKTELTLDLLQEDINGLAKDIININDSLDTALDCMWKLCKWNIKMIEDFKKHEEECDERIWSVEEDYYDFVCLLWEVEEKVKWNRIILICIIVWLVLRCWVLTFLFWFRL